MTATPSTLTHLNWQALGAELVFTQDAQGRYLSFYWQYSSKYDLKNDEVVGTKLEEVFVPIARQIYQERVSRVLDRSIPEQCHCLFEYRGQSFPFELVISPILTSTNKVDQVLVMGHQLHESEIFLTSHHSSLPTYPEPYQRLLTQIARKIRATLDLSTIWQQTVDNLGESLQISRCLLISYRPEPQHLRVEAEYHQLGLRSMLGYQLDLGVESYWQQAVQTQQLVELDFISPDEYQRKSILVVATVYQNQVNGLICLQQCNRYRNWTQAERELVQELAEQVGTAIAQATLYHDLELARIAAEEASRQKSHFLASVSHELRTPLNGIIGFLKLILDGMVDDEEEQTEFLEESHNSALHLLNLINDILDIAKIEAGKMELEFSAIAIETLLEAVASKTRYQAEQKNLYYEVKIPPTYDQILIYGNYQRLLQVLLNLVGNAIKFTNEGGITISAEVIKRQIKRHQQEFPGLLQISVLDTGIGVPLEQQDKLFQNFYQVDAGRTREYGGTGLGLAISQRLVEAMGGKISFYSMGEGLGSNVTFTIPLTQIPIIKTASSDDN